MEISVQLKFNSISSLIDYLINENPYSTQESIALIDLKRTLKNIQDSSLKDDLKNISKKIQQYKESVNSTRQFQENYIKIVEDLVQELYNQNKIMEESLLKEMDKARAVQEYLNLSPL